MKKPLHKLLLLFVICCMGLTPLFSYGQLSGFVLTAPAQPINTCGPAGTFSIAMNPGASASITNTVTVTLPPGIQYVSGSATVDNGATIGSVGGTAAAPVFAIPTLAMGSTTTLTFSATANCSYAGGLRFSASATGSAGNTPVTQSAPINSQSAVFLIPSVTNQNFSGAVLTTYSRTITIQNSGLGLVDTLLVKDTIGKGRVVNSLTGNNGVTVSLVSKTAVNSGNDTAWVWKVYGFSGDAHLDNSESFSLNQSLTITKCANLTDKFWAELNCVGTAGCNSGFITGGTTVPVAAQPSLTVIAPPYNAVPAFPCIDGTTPITSTLAVRNNSSGPAYNVHVLLGGVGSPPNFATGGNHWFDTTTLKLKLNTGSYAPVRADSVALTTSASNCAFGKPWLVRITIPVLNPGDSIRISYDMYHCNPALTNSCATVSLYGAATQVDYTDQCQTNKIFSPFTTLIVYAGAGTTLAKANGNSIIYAGSTNTLAYQHATFGAAGPEYGPSLNGSFIYRISVPSFLSLSTSITNIDLVRGGTTKQPASVTQVSATATDTTYDVLFNFSQIAPTSIGSFLPGAYLFLKNLTGLPCTRNGTVFIPLKMQFLLRPTQDPCFPYIGTGCLNDTLAYVCPNPCPRGGISGSRFSMLRTNYGLPDNNNDGLPDGATLDMSKVRTDMATLGDTIAATVSGKVIFGTQTNFANGYFEPKTSLFLTAGSLAPIDASISIYTPAGTLRGTCSNLPLTNTGTNQVRADFSISSISACIPGYTRFADGDSLVATIRYRDNYGLSSGNPQITALVPGYFYLSDKINPTLAADKYGCDTGFASFTLLPMYYTHTNSLPSSSSNGCDTITATVNSYMSIGACCNNYGNLMFPYEFRNLAVPGVQRVALQNRMRYAGKARIISWTYGGVAVPYDISNLATVYADSVTFDIRNLFADKGGPLRMPDEGWQLSYTVSLVPDCGSGQAPFNTNFKSYNESLKDPIYTQSSTSATTGVVINSPVVSISTSPQTENVTGNTAIWELQVSNAAANAPANFAWLTKGTGGTTTIQSLERLSGAGGSVVSTLIPVNGLYQLGTLGTGSNTYYRATVRYTNCTKDTLNIAYGYSCFSYPASVAAASCVYNASQLYIVPQPAQLQMSLLTQPVNQQQLCVDTTYIVQLSNVQLGTTYNPVIKATLPTAGFAITPGSSFIEYPVGTASVPIADPVLVNGAYTWNVASAPALAGTLPGNTTLKLQFKARATGCDFASGDYPVFTASGTNGCGTTITAPSVSGRPFILVGDPLGSVNNFILRKQLSNASLLACPGGGITYTYVAINNGTGPSNPATESLVIEAPSWLTMTGYTPIHNGPSPAFNTVTAGTINTYSWGIPAGVAVGDSVKFSVQFGPAASASIPACGSNFLIRDMVTNTFSTSAANCGGDECSSKTIRGLDTISIAVEKYNLQPTYLYVTPGVNENVIALKITNAGSRAYSGTMMYAVYADMNGDGLLDAGDVQVSPTLTSTQPLGANAVDTFSNVISLSGASLDPSVLGKQTLLVVKDSSCNCATTFKAAAPTSVALPVTLISFTGRRVGSNDLLNWVTSEEQNMEGYEVEYSTDAVHYTALGKVAATGNGSTQKQSYQYTHVGVSGNGWYRLRIRELDGSFRYSRVVKISGTENAGLCLVNTGIYPVPFVNELHIGLYSCTDKPATIQLYTAHGKKLLEQDYTLKAGSSYYTLSNLGRLPAGTYIVRVQTDSDVLIEKAVKY